MITDFAQQATTFPYGDFFLSADGPGQVPRFPAFFDPPCKVAPDTAPCVASQTDQLSIWTATSGTVVAPADALFQAHGLRVGYQPQFLNLTPMEEFSDETFEKELRPSVQFALDPHTLLVPIEVVVLYTDKVPINDPTLEADNVDHQLTFWDGNPGLAEFSQITQALSPHGEALLSTTRRFKSWGATVKDLTTGRTTASGHWTPDSIWSTCGIQFRLVNFLPIKTDDAHLAASDSLCPIDQRQLLEDIYSTLIVPNPKHIPDAAIVVFNRGGCTCRSDQVGVESGAQALPGKSLACFSLGSPGAFVPAHELGHVLGLSDAYDSPGSCLPAGDLQSSGGIMCSEADKPTPTPHECDGARIGANDYRKFWQH